MARRKKQSKKQDETLVDLVEASGQAQDFFESNQNLIFGALVGLVVIIGGLFAYNNFYKTPRQQEAVQQMFQAEQQFGRDSFALALTNPGGGYKGFLGIMDDYKGTAAANLSKYYAGISYLHLGQYQAAIDYLEDYSPDGEVTPIMVNGALGDAYSEMDDLQGALKYYNKAVSTGDNELLTAYYLKKVGMLNEKLGDKAAAQAAYTRIKQDYFNSPEGRDIDKYIERTATNS